MPFEECDVNEFIKKSCIENPKFHELYAKNRADYEIMSAFSSFRQDLSFKKKAKRLKFKKRKLERIVADDPDSATLKDLKKLADGMGMVLQIKFVPKEEAMQECLDELEKK